MSSISTHLGSSSKGKWEGHAPFNMATIPGSGSRPAKPILTHKVWPKKMLPTGQTELKITI